MEAEFQLSVHNKLPEELKKKIEDLKAALSERDMLVSKDGSKDGKNTREGSQTRER